MTLMLLDSASLWYRAYYGMPDTLVAPNGTPVNAIRGYLDMTARLIGMYRPNRIVACIEGDWRPTWRVELFPAYKANRVDESGAEEEPDTLAPQIPILLDLIEAFGINVIGVDDYEADDVIASFSEQQPGPIRIVTGDRDMFQLVDDEKNVAVVYLAKGLSKHELVDRKWVAQKYAIPGDRYGLFATFRGDPSDGLPGVKGIGEKGAALIANHFSSAEEALAGAHSGHPALPSALAKKIIDGSDYLAFAPTLVGCAKDISLPQISLGLPKRPKNFDLIKDLQQEYALGASVDRLIAALQW
ncbi:MAG: 5'-3' exonuclease [Actinobacteria bacterium]|nr:5'-3' exonuclease [Actinomycetota bacterium]